MKTKIKPLLFFLFGIGLMASLQLLTQCNKEDDFLKNTISKEESKDMVDYKAIEKAIDQFEDAFKAADQTAINALTFGETLEMQASGLNTYTAEELEEIGKAFRKAKVSVATENYAIFNYTIEGIEFSFSMAIDEDGEWKLVRY